MAISNQITPRRLNFILFALAVAGMAFALYLQHVVRLDPCPLCIFQRIGLVVMGVFALLNALINPKKLPAKLGLWLVSLLGIVWSVGVAARHVWLTYLPADKVPACGPGLNYWVETLPILQVFTEVLKGSGECAVIDWTLFGFSLPELSLAFFSVLLALHGWLLSLYLKNHTKSK